MVKKLKKQYETPNEGWNQERMSKEEELMEDYGLKNKKEIYKAQSQLRSFRRQARKLVAQEDEEAQKEIIERVNNLGLTRKNTGLQGLLTLKTTDILDRRIQTAVERKGYADTIKHARQLVVHGHIYIGEERVNTPGYLLTQDEEKKLEKRMPEKDEADDETADEETENEETTEEQEESETEPEEENTEETEEKEEGEQ